jgi:PleD family two-component response regulator
MTQALFRRADEALYLAKTRGSARLVTSDPLGWAPLGWDG